MCTGLTEYPACQLTEDLTEARVTHKAYGSWCQNTTYFQITTIMTITKTE